MLGKKNRQQKLFFKPRKLRDLIPDDHILVKVDKVLDLSWLDDAVRHTYSEGTGRASIPPEVAVRLMLAGFLLGIVHDRRLEREARVNVAIRWFAGLELEDEIPDHSSMTRIRGRWGEELFREIFTRTVRECDRSGLLSDCVHIDATFIRADVGLDSLVERHVEAVIDENESSAEKRKRKRRSKRNLVSATDPDASMARSSRKGDFEPRYKQHTAVDSASGVVVDVDVTTGKASEGAEILKQVRRTGETLGRMPGKVTADAGYASGENYRGLEEMGAEPLIVPRPEKRVGEKISKHDFRYDSLNHVVKCPAGKELRRTTRDDTGWYYTARTEDCRNCELRDKCLPPSQKRRKILIVHGEDAVLRARRRFAEDGEVKSLMKRHKGIVEGRHGEAKENHGLRRAVRRGIGEVLIQAFLTAAAMNLKRLAASFLALYALCKAAHRAPARLERIFRRIIPIRSVQPRVVPNPFCP
jgi:transposase